LAARRNDEMLTGEDLVFYQVMKQHPEYRDY
jgi:hypothetical protein